MKSRDSKRRPQQQAVEKLTWIDVDGCRYTYHLAENGTACIDSCVPAGFNVSEGGPSSWSDPAGSRHVDIVVPCEIDGHLVTAFGPGAFMGLAGVRSITCPPHVRKIASRAFEECPNLVELHMPEDLDKFDSYWVRGCPSLDVLWLPGAMEALDANILTMCSPRTLVLGSRMRRVNASALASSQVETVRIVEGNGFLTTDGICVFEPDSPADGSLERESGGLRLQACIAGRGEVRVPDGCTSIGPAAFSHSKRVGTVRLPESVKSIGDGAFLGASVKHVEMPRGLASIGAKAFYECRDLEELELPDSLLAIGTEAFARSGIEAMAVPAGTKSIGLGAFSKTPMIERGGHGGSRPRPGAATTSSPIAGSEISLVFEEGSSFVVSPDGALYLREQDDAPQNGSADANRSLVLVEMLDSKATTLSILPGTRRIASEAAFRRESLERVSFPEGLEHIGAKAFSECRKLSQVNWPRALKSIGDEAFKNTLVDALEIPAGFEKLGKVPFLCHSKRRHETASRLRDVRVDPRNELFRIDNGILCQKNRSVTSGGGFTENGPDGLPADNASGTWSAVMYVGPTKRVTIPKDVDVVMPYAFCGYYDIENLRIHDHLREAGFNSIMVDGTIRSITLEGGGADGGDLTVEFPDMESCHKFQTLNYPGGVPDGTTLFGYSDSLIYWVDDPFERICLALERLANPVFLHKANKLRLNGIVEHDAVATAKLLALRGHTAGLEQMVDLGYINSENIAALVESVSAADNAQMAGYLLEMRHRRFGKPKLDLGL